MKAIVVTDQAAGTAGMKLAERPEPQAAINDGEVKAKVASQGLHVLATCGDAYGALIHRRYDEYGQAIHEFNLTQQ